MRDYNTNFLTPSVMDNAAMISPVTANGGRILSLIPANDPMLHTQAEAFVFDNLAESEQLALDLVATMRYNNGALGLSAVQVGIPKKVFSMETGGEMPAVLFNARVVSQSEDTDVMNEGCLSYPNLILPIRRSKVVKMRFQNMHGQWSTMDFKDMTARVALHEYDHCQGVTFDSKVSKLKLQMARKKALKGI